MYMNLFENLTEVPLLGKVLETGSKVIRVRMHNEPNMEFKCQKEVSYPPSNYARLMRANLDNQPMFYGSLFPLKYTAQQDMPRLTCLAETSEELWDKNFVGKKEITFSLWIAKRPIKLFVIPIFDSYKKPVVEFEWYSNLWEYIMSEHNTSDEIRNSLKELSKQFSFIPKNEEEAKSCYSYTANFTQNLLSQRTDIDGIVYPSARLGQDGIGINVAIRPAVIDSSFELRACHICHFFKRTSEHQLILIYKESRIQQNGKIKYLLHKEYFHDIDYQNQIHPDFRIKELNFKY